MTRRSALVASVAAGLVVVGVSALSGYMGIRVGRHYEDNKHCCLIPKKQNVRLSFTEAFGLTRSYSQIGQDRWVTEVVFPGVTNGYFLDVGSGDGTEGSNTKLLEEKGWSGICVDPFPTNMEGRRCQMFKEVVYDQAGQKVQFKVAGELGGISDTLGRWKDWTAGSQTVEFTTVTLGDILERAHAPKHIHYMSLDIEGAELKALQGLPLDKYTFGALDIEHNQEEPKRTDIQMLLKKHGYRRVHTWLQDDFYTPDAS